MNDTEQPTQEVRFYLAGYAYCEHDCCYNIAIMDRAHFDGRIVDSRMILELNDQPMAEFLVRILNKAEEAGDIFPREFE